MGIHATSSALERSYNTPNKVTAEIYQRNPGRYIVVSGYEVGAPRCPYGNLKKWVGYDTLSKEYIRFTKSVYRKLVENMENKKI